MRRLQRPRSQRRQPTSHTLRAARISPRCCGKSTPRHPTQPPKCPSHSARLRQAPHRVSHRQQLPQLPAACLATQVVRLHLRFPSPSPQLAEQAHPRPEAVCLEELEEHPARREGSLATQAVQPRPQPQRPPPAHRSLARLPAPHLEEGCLAAPQSRQETCSATPRPLRQVPQLPQGHPACSVLNLPKLLLARRQPLWEAQRAVFLELQLLHPRPRAAQLQRREDCLVVPAVQCSAQVLLLLARPALRRPPRSRCLEG